jgi:hypothetical protein
LACAASVPIGVRKPGPKTQHIGRVLEEPEFLLVSDGGYPPLYRFAPKRIPGLASLALMLRVNAIALEQVSALRRRRLVWMFGRQQPNGLLVGPRQLS